MNRKKMRRSDVVSLIEYAAVKKILAMLRETAVSLTVGNISLIVMYGIILVEEDFLPESLSVLCGECLSDCR